jgi:hypothetical protein
MRKNEWHCKKCNCWIGTHIDRDYHDNTVHPDFSNPYVASWWNKGRPGMSPYD